MLKFSALLPDSVNKISLLMQVSLAQQAAYNKCKQSSKLDLYLPMHKHNLGKPLEGGYFQIIGVIAFNIVVRLINGLFSKCLHIKKPL